MRAEAACDSFGDVLGAPDAGEWIGWLRRRPMVQEGRLGGQHFAMVHAAAHPDWSLEELGSRARAVESQLAAEDLDDVRRLLAGEDDEGGECDTLERLTNCRSVTLSGSMW